MLWFVVGQRPNKMELLFKSCTILQSPGATCSRSPLIEARNPQEQQIYWPSAQIACAMTSPDVTPSGGSPTFIMACTACALAANMCVRRPNNVGTASRVHTAARGPSDAPAQERVLAKGTSSANSTRCCCCMVRCCGLQLLNLDQHLLQHRHLCQLCPQVLQLGTQEGLPGVCGWRHRWSWCCCWYGWPAARVDTLNSGWRRCSECSSSSIWGCTCWHHVVTIVDC